MRISVYTSCALNYLPKARVLAESLAAAEPEATLTLCLNDVPPPWLDLSAEPFHRIWQPADLGYGRGWIFQHDVMELATAVKGRALLCLIEADRPDLAVYLDPDVWVLNPLAPLDDYLGDAAIGLVPHILAPEESAAGIELTELSVAAHGVYNLGHLVLRPDRRGLAFARWWAERLDAYCFDDRARGLFTDQRWVDLAPAMFEGVKILKMPNLDVASWNLSHRTLRQGRRGDPASITVDGWPLITYHFSGTGPAGTHRRIREIFAPGSGAAAEIERLYEAAIARHGQAELGGRRPGFDLFDDGTPISAEARRLYRAHQDLRRAFPDPYACPPHHDVSGAPSYRDWLRETRPGAIAGLALPDARLDRAYLDLFDADFYLARHPDAAAAIEAGQFADALDHYQRLGNQRLYDPNEFFVAAYYLDRVLAAGLGAAPSPHVPGAGRREGTLLWHYLTVGLPAGFEPIELFDSRWYLEQNTDLAAAFRQGRISTPLGHFLQDGSREGRDPGPHFRGTDYLEATPPARELAGAEDVRGPFGALVRLGGVAGRVVV